MKKILMKVFYMIYIKIYLNINFIFTTINLYKIYYFKLLYIIKFITYLSISLNLY